MHVGGVARHSHMLRDLPLAGCALGHTVLREGWGEATPPAYRAGEMGASTGLCYDELCRCGSVIVPSGIPALNGTAATSWTLNIWNAIGSRQTVGRVSPGRFVTRQKRRSPDPVSTRPPTDQPPPGRNVWKTEVVPQ